MNKVDKLYEEYKEIKNKVLETNSLNFKEDLKNKLMELDYEMNASYEEKLKNKFPMTTTLDKEEIRLEKLIEFIEIEVNKQKNLINDYKEITGYNIALSHLKYSDKLKEYRERLLNIKRLLSIKGEIKKTYEIGKEKNEVKLKVLKNRLMKKEMLNLLYEFCLVDSLDVHDIDLDRIIEEKQKEQEKAKELAKPQLPKVEVEQPKQELPKVVVPPKKVEPKSIIEEVKTPEVVEIKEENKILTSMPKITKFGTVSPVNVFDSLKKAEEELPNVVIPSNGLTEDNSQIFINTEKYFN